MAGERSDNLKANLWFRCDVMIEIKALFRQIIGKGLILDLLKMVFSTTSHCPLVFLAAQSPLGGSGLFPGKPARQLQVPLR